MKKEETGPKTREQVFAEKAEKSYAICYTQTCPLRLHCLRWQLQSYTPKDRRIAACVNLNNPAMQTEACPMYRNDQPIRMPLGIVKMYYDMPQRIAHPLYCASVHIGHIQDGQTAVHDGKKLTGDVQGVRAGWALRC